MTNIVVGMETLQTILAGCIEAEMTTDGLLEDVNNKSERLPVVAAVLNVNHIIDWRLCCKQQLGE